MRPIFLMSLGLVFIVAGICIGVVELMSETAQYAIDLAPIEPLAQLEIPPEPDSGLPWNEWLKLGLMAVGVGIGGAGLVLQFKTFRRSSQSPFQRFGTFIHNLLK